MKRTEKGMKKRRAVLLAPLSAVAIVLAMVFPLAGTTLQMQTAQASTTTAASALSQLTVKSDASTAGYSRDQFGNDWEDVDNNNCDTRDDILKRDLTHVTYKTGNTCVITSGTLNDPYTGKTINFVRGENTSQAVQIDHVVALGNAWETGAQSLTTAKRTQLANDPLELLAVDGPTNGKKGDKDAAEWIPSNTKADCAYVARQITVKQKYGLWVTSSEKNEMSRVLSTCPNQPLATGTTGLDISSSSSSSGVTVSKPVLTYRTHVQTYGWQKWMGEGATSGTTGKAKRLEAIEIRLSGRSQATKGEIQYRTHVQTYGWQKWVNTGTLSGTTGKAKRLEAISIRLTDNLAKRYDVYYRVHAQHFGWMGWAKDGANAGTAGYAYRLEAIQIRLVTKGGAAPGSTSTAFRQAPAKKTPAKAVTKKTSTPTRNTGSSSLPVKTAGSYCKKSDKGKHARTSTGVTLTCKTTSSDSRLRWRH